MLCLLRSQVGTKGGMTCNFYKKKGHLKKDCWKLKAKQSDESKSVKLVPPKLAILKMRIMMLVLLLLLVNTRVVVLGFWIWDVQDKWL